ncbi:MAG: type II secretion system protein [Bacilli bacterium]
MKLNHKGFTLIELLGVLVILSVIMLIAVPNVMSIMDRNKKDIYIADAKKLVTMAEYAIRSDTSIPLPSPTEIIVLPLKFITNGDLLTDPDGNKYSEIDSYVAINKKNGFDEYYVNLVGISPKGNNRGVYLTKIDDINSLDSSRYKKIIKDMDLTKGNNIAKVICGSTTCKSVRTYNK